jgi:hypothetical protein
MSQNTISSGLGSNEEYAQQNAAHLLTDDGVDVIQEREKQRQQGVKLISADGLEFIIPRSCAFNSGTLRSILSSPGQFTETIANQIHLKAINGIVLERVVQYLMYKDKYSKAEILTKDGKLDISAGIPDFNISPDIALELLMASDFLDC